MVQKISKKKTKIIWRGFLIRLSIIFFVGIFFTFGGFLYKIYVLEKKITSQSSSQNNGSNEQTNNQSFLETAKTLVTGEKKALRGQDRGRINILLLGMGGEGHSGKYLTDTIILASVDTKTYQSSMLSIPRDLYVKIPETNVYTKINAVYAYEMLHSNYQGEPISKLKKLIKEITGQDVDYYIAMDFEGFKKIIDEIHGVDVEVPKDILDTRYPGPNFSYTTFEIKKGFHHLDGETALKYSRVRHIEGGDFGRAGRQQQVLAATKKKAFSIETLASPIAINDIINTLGEHLRTDVYFDEIPSFLNLAGKINIYSTTNKVLDAWNEDSILASSHVPLGGIMAYTLVPRAKNYSQIKELSGNIFDLEMIARKKKAIEQEQASIQVIVPEKQNPYKIQIAFKKLGYEVATEKNNLSDLCKEKTILYLKPNSSKYFTLDDLADKLEATVDDNSQNNFGEDIVVCLSEDNLGYFDSQNDKETDEDENLKEQSVIDNNGNIRVNEK